MANAPEPVPQHYDAPEVYAAQDGYYAPKPPVSPSSPPPQYGNEGLIPDTRYSTYKPEVAVGATPVGDTENAGAGAGVPKKRLRDRRVCGAPLLWFIALLAFILIAAIVGGVVGGVLGTKKKDPAPVAATTTAPASEPETSTTTTASSTTSSSSASATPSSSVLFKPKADTWYYLRNDLLDSKTVLDFRVVFDNSTGNGTALWSIVESTGDPYEHWGFWPASLNSTIATDYQTRQGIESQLFILYNRGLLQNNNITAPNQKMLDDQTSWWYFSKHPVAPYQYLQGGWQGQEFAFTISDTGRKGTIDDQYDVEWNRTDTTDDAAGEAIKKGQAWKPELAFAMLAGEKQLWDAPLTPES